MGAYVGHSGKLCCKKCRGYSIQLDRMCVCVCVCVCVLGLGCACKGKMLFYIPSYTSILRWMTSRSILSTPWWTGYWMWLHRRSRTERSVVLHITHHYLNLYHTYCNTKYSSGDTHVFTRKMLCISLLFLFLSCTGVGGHTLFGQVEVTSL